MWNELILKGGVAILLGTGVLLTACKPKPDAAPKREPKAAEVEKVWQERLMTVAEMELPDLSLAPHQIVVPPSDLSNAALVAKVEALATELGGVAVSGPAEGADGKIERLSVMMPEHQAPIFRAKLTGKALPVEEAKGESVLTLIEVILHGGDAVGKSEEAQP